MIQALTTIDPGALPLNVTLDAVRVSLICSVSATLLAALIGAPIGVLLGRSHFPGRRPLLVLARTGMAMPTVVVGLLFYALLSRSGPLGAAGLLYSRTAIVIGELALALPIVISLFASSAQALPANLERTAATLGASRLRIFLTVLQEARLGLMTAVLAAFGRVVSELGIAMMLGGNIKHVTRTMTTTIALETQKGAFAQSLAIGGILLAIALGVNAIAHIVGLSADRSATAEREERLAV